MAHILVVESDSLFQDKYKAVLTQKGHTVTIVNAADEAVSKIKDLHPDVLITDLKLSHKSGLELLEELTGIAKGLPIIVATALASLKEEVSYFYGGDRFAYHSKPVDFSKMLADIDRLAALKW